MNKIAFVLAVMSLCIVGCSKQEVPTTQIQCEQTLCKKDSVKSEVPKSVRDSLAKIESKVKKIKAEIRGLNKIADSLHVADSLSGKPLLATAYLKDKLNKEKSCARCQVQDSDG